VRGIQKQSLNIERGRTERSRQTCRQAGDAARQEEDMVKERRNA
jgi:hypothetical protein